MNEKSKQQCARCGSCTVVCPVYRVTGRETLAARGKLHLLTTELAQEPSDHYQDLFAQCLLCGACEDNCSRQLPIRDLIVAARSAFSTFYGKHPLQRLLARKILSRPTLLEGLVKAGVNLSHLSLLPKESGLRLKLALLEEKNITRFADNQAESSDRKLSQQGMAYFSGCLARYMQPSVGEATTQLVENLSGSSVHEPSQQVCCGLAAWSGGKMDEARKLARQNIEAFESSSGEILTSCASCSAHLLKYPSLFADDSDWHAKAKQFSSRVREFTSFVNEKMVGHEMSVEAPALVHYHEPCHLRFDEECKGAARHLLGAIDNVELVASEEGNCCGQGGLFHLGYPALSEAIFAKLRTHINHTEADVVVTSCSGCLMQWQAGLAQSPGRVQAQHLAHWLWSNVQING